ncbi:hypothetical protein BH23GEM9_BH23GEM9_32000 [soil metagenome]
MPGTRSASSRPVAEHGGKAADSWQFKQKRAGMSEYTVGVEEEYQLVHPATGALQSGGRAVLDTDWSGEIRKELQESTIEVGTRVCETSAMAERELLRLRLQAATAAAADAVARLLEAVHPVADALKESQAIDGVARILERGNGAARMRAVAAKSAGLADMVHWLMAETMVGVGLDRRLDQRDAAAS